jgi:uncharacterized damage-inducible protein DinB
MHVNLETLRQHIDYTVWASRRILDAAASLTPEELIRDFGTADKSVLGTMLHIWGGDLVWIERMHGTSLTKRPYDEHATLATLQAEWPRVWERWQNYVALLTEESAEADIVYTTFKGLPYRTPVWQIVLHVVNHGTHHRGQAAGFIRTLGKTPPVLDIIEYYRTKSPS